MPLVMGKTLTKLHKEVTVRLGLEKVTAKIPLRDKAKPSYFD